MELKKMLKKLSDEKIAIMFGRLFGSKTIVVKRKKAFVYLVKKEGLYKETRPIYRKEIEMFLWVMVYEQTNNDFISGITKWFDDEFDLDVTLEVVNQVIERGANENNKNDSK